MPDKIQKLKQKYPSVFEVVEKDALSKSAYLGARQYTTKEVSAFIGVAPRALAYWIAEGLISSHGTLGKGYRRTFSVRNLLEVFILNEMSRFSFQVSKMKEVIKALTKSGYFDRLDYVQREHEAAMVYMDQEGQVQLQNGKPCDSWLQQRKTHFVINLHLIEREVSRLVREYEPGHVITEEKKREAPTT